MYVVYILYSIKYDKIQVGYISNLKKRIISHNELGNKGWTIKSRPQNLVHSEEHETKKLALSREKQLKTAKSRSWIWSEIIAK